MSMMSGDFRYQLPKMNPDSWVKELNEALYSSDMDIASEFEQKGALIKLSPMYDKLYAGRSILIAQIKAPGRKEFRQGFYSSTGKATPGVSPAGTIQPISCIWDDSMLDEFYGADHDLPDGWIGKHQWSPSMEKWLNHHKTLESIAKPYQDLIKTISSM